MMSCPQFDLPIRLGTINYITGARCKGKHTLFRYLYSQIHSQIDELYVCTLHDRYDSLTVTDNIFRDVQLLDQLLGQLLSDLERYPVTQRVIVLDVDGDLDQYLTRPPQWLQGLFMNGRHLGLTIFIVSQYPYSFSPALRANIDNIFVLNEQKNVYLKTLYDHYGDFIFALDDFKCTVMEATACTGRCLVIGPDRRTYYLQSELIDDKQLSRKVGTTQRQRHVSIREDVDSLKKKLIDLRDQCSRLIEQLDGFVQPKDIPPVL